MTLSQITKRTSIVAFDLDGVITNSIECMQKAWDKTSHTFSLNIPFEYYKHHIGKPFPAILNLLGISNNHSAIQSEYISNCSIYSDLISVYPTIQCVLSTLASTSYIAIVTSKPRSRTHFLLEHLKIDVDIVLCPEDVSFGKPHPESLNFLNSYFDISPTRSIFVGDMISDYECAMAAGWAFVFAKYGFGDLGFHHPLTALSSDMLLEIIQHHQRCYE